ncbi:MAG: methionine gamma-lyase family protein, partial [Firmicutes bacterium]|nr:methionine gamma-lyase family protein [Bacillota bacterium]
MLNNEIKKIYFEKFGVSEKVLDIISQAEAKCADIFEKADKIAELNQLKVLYAMQKHHLAEAHFASTTGYGYNDLGRDALEAVYAEIFKAEDALVRPQLISGTHALTVALAGNLRPNDELFSPV